MLHPIRKDKRRSRTAGRINKIFKEEDTITHNVEWVHAAMDDVKNFPERERIAIAISFENTFKPSVVELSFTADGTTVRAVYGLNIT